MFPWTALNILHSIIGTIILEVLLHNNRPPAGSEKCQHCRSISDLDTFDYELYFYTRFPGALYFSFTMYKKDTQL